MWLLLLNILEFLENLRNKGISVTGIATRIAESSPLSQMLEGHCQKRKQDLDISV